MYVLAVDTSSPAVMTGVVSVDDPGGRSAGVVAAAERAPLAARGHGELLAPCIAEVLREAGVDAGDLAAVVAGTGPGPFTGLRVGLVTAAAFADALGLPTYGVCSLDAIGLACADETALLVASDARRREVYWARYEHGAPVGAPAVGAAADVPLDGLTAVAGAGGELYADVWPELARRTERYPDPVSLVRCALPRLTGAAPSEALTPLYLRRPDAVPGAPKRVSQ